MIACECGFCFHYPIIRPISGHCLLCVPHRRWGAGGGAPAPSKRSDDPQGQNYGMNACDWLALAIVGRRLRSAPRAL